MHAYEDKLGRPQETKKITGREDKAQLNSKLMKVMHVVPSHKLYEISRNDAHVSIGKYTTHTRATLVSLVHCLLASGS